MKSEVIECFYFIDLLKGMPWSSGIPLNTPLSDIKGILRKLIFILLHFPLLKYKSFSKGLFLLVHHVVVSVPQCNRRSCITPYSMAAGSNSSLVQQSAQLIMEQLTMHKQTNREVNETGGDRRIYSTLSRMRRELLNFLFTAGLILFVCDIWIRAR